MPFTRNGTTPSRLGARLMIDAVIYACLLRIVNAAHVEDDLRLGNHNRITGVHERVVDPLVRLAQYAVGRDLVSVEGTGMSDRANDCHERSWCRAKAASVTPATP